MAKKSETSLAVAEQETGLAVATADDFGGGFAIEGREETGPSISRVVMYTGTATEKKKYGMHEDGVFLDALENRELGKAINIMPIVCYATYAVWPEGAVAPTQSWNNQKEVPPDLLKWNEDASGKRLPPEASETINVVCVVQGTADGAPKTEFWPYLLQFKSTGLKAFENQIKPLEVRRAMLRKTPGFYEITGKDDKNSSNQDFKRLTARPLGDPPADVVKLGKTIFDASQKMRTAAEALNEASHEDAAEFDPNAH